MNRTLPSFALLVLTAFVSFVALVGSAEAASDECTSDGGEILTAGTNEVFACPKASGIAQFLEDRIPCMKMISNGRNEATVLCVQAAGVAARVRGCDFLTEGTRYQKFESLDLNYFADFLTRIKLCDGTTMYIGH